MHLLTTLLLHLLVFSSSQFAFAQEPHIPEVHDDSSKRPYQPIAIPRPRNAQPERHHPTSQTLNNGAAVVCRAEGLCEPCPEGSINDAFCQPYGNRRLIKCLPKTPENEKLMADYMAAHRRPPKPPSSNSNSNSTKANDGTNAGIHFRPGIPGESPAWEACGRVVAIERADFWEFLICNLFFATLALFLIVARSKRLAAIQYRKLAARIGIGSGGNSGSGGASL